MGVALSERGRRKEGEGGVGWWSRAASQHLFLKAQYSSFVCVCVCVCGKES